MIVALSGGIGGAKLALGLARTLPAGELTVVVNTGDDFEHLGFAISPDVDTLTYVLAGLDDPVRGWGRRDETWQFMKALGEVGGETWFSLGDQDLALHVERTRRLRAGEPLSAVTAAIASRLGIASRVLPMSDDPVRTEVAVDTGWIAFQEYFVRQRCAPAVRAIRYVGADRARPAPGVIESLAAPDLQAVVICPSNPWLSIDPILAVPGLRAALAAAPAPVLAVCPLVGGQAIKGPTAKLMDELGIARGIAAIGEHYADCIDTLVIDRIDAGTPCPIPIAAADTVMKTAKDKESLARAVIAIADGMTVRGPGGRRRR
ncbi:MAG: 2-phospho-L-lactate transferase [Lautropia sp.]